MFIILPIPSIDFLAARYIVASNAPAPIAETRVPKVCDPPAKTFTAKAGRSEGKVIPNKPITDTKIKISLIGINLTQ